MLFHSPVIMQDARPKMVDALLTLISMMGQGEGCVPLYLLRRPILPHWMDVTLQLFDCWMGMTVNRWHSVDAHLRAHLRDITNSYWVLNNCTQNAYNLYWQPIDCFYALSFESKSFKTFQFLSHHDTHHLIDEWHRFIACQRFRPAISGIKIHPLVLDIYSLMSTPFLIQLILLDFHNVP